MCPRPPLFGDPAAEPVPATLGRDSLATPDRRPRRRPRPPDLEALIAGGDEAWARFLEFYEWFSSPLISRWFSDCQDPEEFKDELLCRLTEAILKGMGPSTTGSLVQWMRGAVRNACATGIRKARSERERRARIRTVKPLGETVGSDPSDDEWTPSRLRELVHLLPPRRENWISAIRLRARKAPWSYERIASRSGVGPGTVRCWIFRAKASFQGLPPSALRRPSGYTLVPRGRGYAAIPRHPRDARGTPSSCPPGSPASRRAPAIKESRSSSG